jgi:GntR family transcriptional regulator, arabinose operon transcriptional repressor
MSSGLRPKPAPAYLKILRDLERRIDSDEFSPQMPVPSEREICVHYNVSRITARRALDELASRGRIVRLQGKGSFISKQRARSSGEKIALVVDGVYDHGCLPIVLRGIEEESHKLGYQVSFFNGEGRFDKHLEITERILSSGFSGVIMDPHQSDEEYERNTELIDALEEEQIPVVLVQKYPFHHPDCYSFVVSDDYRGGYLMTEHLLKIGHRQIAFLQDAFNSSSFNRLQGYRSALLEYGVEPCEYLVRKVGNPQGVEATLKEWLDYGDQRPSAVFAVNDLMAYMAVHALDLLGVSIPKELALVGYDDLPTSRFLAVPLTTVVQQIERIGTTAMKALQFRMNGHFDDRIQFVCPVDLVVRESCGWRQRTTTIPNEIEAMLFQSEPPVGRVVASRC